MIKPEDIPLDAVEAYLEAVEHGCGVYETLSRVLNAWPGAFTCDIEDVSGVRCRIILPLKENGDDR